MKIQNPKSLIFEFHFSNGSSFMTDSEELAEILLDRDWKEEDVRAVTVRLQSSNSR